MKPWILYLCVNQAINNNYMYRWIEMYCLKSCTKTSSRIRLLQSSSLEGSAKFDMLHFLSKQYKYGYSPNLKQTSQRYTYISDWSICHLNKKIPPNSLQFHTQQAKEPSSMHPPRIKLSIPTSPVLLHITHQFLFYTYCFSP